MIQLDSNQIRFPQSANLNILKTAPILPFSFRLFKILSGTCLKWQRFGTHKKYIMQYVIGQCLKKRTSQITPIMLFSVYLHRTYSKSCRRSTPLWHPVASGSTPLYNRREGSLHHTLHPKVDLSNRSTGCSTFSSSLSWLPPPWPEAPCAPTGWLRRAAALTEPWQRSLPSRAPARTGAAPPATAPPWFAPTGTTGWRGRSAVAGQEVARLVRIPTSLQLVTMAASHPSAGQEGGQVAGQEGGQGEEARLKDESLRNQPKSMLSMIEPTICKIFGPFPVVLNLNLRLIFKHKNWPKMF